MITRYFRIYHTNLFGHNALRSKARSYIDVHVAVFTVCPRCCNEYTFRGMISIWRACHVAASAALLPPRKNSQLKNKYSFPNRGVSCIEQSADVLS